MKGIKLYRILGIMLVLVGLVWSTDGMAQAWTLDIKGRVKKEETNKRFEGVTITVKRNGAVWKTLTSPVNGEFDVPLPPDAIYIIEFSKPGHVTKRVEFSTKNVPPEDAKYGFDFPMEMNLFEEIEGLDVSILNQPIAKVGFDPETGIMDYDPAYTKSIQKELERLKEELAKRKKELEEERKRKQKDYDAAIAAADKAFNAEKWAEAKPLYEKASEIFPDESYPLFQLGEISDKLASAEALEAKYKSAIEKADAEFKERKWEAAKNHYEIAAELKENEEYPQNRIKEIEEIIKNEEKVNEDYNAAIADADAAMTQKDYEEAKKKYTEASTLKSYEEYPKEKLTEIDGILAEQAKKDQEYKDAIAEGDQAFGTADYEKAIAAYEKAKGVKPEETYPQEKIDEANELIAQKKALQEQYDKLIADADAAFGEKKYEDAKSKYEEALDLLKNESYPKEKIAEIDGLIAAADKLEADYKAAIEEGDNNFDDEKYEAAKAGYEKALTLKSEETYPKDRLKEIETKMAELAEQKALDEKYNALIASADGALASQDYEKAKADYQAALGVKSGESYPQEKIEEIDGILAAAAELEANYKAAVAEGDNAFGSKDYQSAQLAFEKATELKPEEQYPKDKIAEIKKLIEEQLAAMATDEKYNALIEAADNAFDNESYDNAKGKYNEALGVKPDETHPKDRLAEIEKILERLKEEEANALAAEAARKKKEYFDAIVAEADALLASEDLDAAKGKYNEALGVMPDEQYPKDKLVEIDKLIKEKQDSEAALLAQKQLDAKYDALINSADDALDAENYDKATADYKAALALKAQEAYPQNQLKKIEDILARLAEKEKEIQLTNNAMKQKQEQYDAYVKLADEAFAQKQYEKSKSNYELALGIMPSEQYPKDKIKEIEDLLAQLAQQDLEAKNAAEAEKKKRAAYDNLINEGDRAMRTEEYKLAQGKFNAALEMYPDEKYPSDKLIEITNILNALAQEKEKEVVAVTPTNGSRASITDAKEREIEKKMAKLRNKAIVEKDQALQADKDNYEKQAEIRLTSSIDRLEKADKELDNYEDDRAAMYARGNKYHLENNKTLLATTKKLQKAQDTRIKNADKRREKADEELQEIAEDKVEFAADQRKRSEKIAKDHDKYVEDVKDAQADMMAQGEKQRANNIKDIAKLTDNVQKNKQKNFQRAINKQIDINEYKEQIKEENQIILKASYDRRAENQEELDQLAADMREQRIDNGEFFRGNSVELEKFRERMTKLQEGRIKNADKARMANNKQKLKMQEQLVKNEARQTKRYYKDIKQQDKIKANVEKNRAKRTKEANKRTVAADKAIIKQKESMKEAAQSQEPRYIEFDKQLEKVRATNEEFYTDRNKLQSKKMLAADASIRDVYRGEDRERIDELAGKYPQGITEEIVESGNSITIKRFKVTGEQVDVYERVFYPWGGTFYYKNGENITKTLWDKESIE